MNKYIFLDRKRYSFGSCIYMGNGEGQKAKNKHTKQASIRIHHRMTFHSMNILYSEYILLNTLYIDYIYKNH